MQTKAGDPGAFAHFDLSRVDSPAFVVDAAKLRANCRVLAGVRDAAAADGADIKVFAALKAYSMWSAAPIIGEYLDGVSTSGLWEARLASEFYDGEIATFSAAFKPEELGAVRGWLGGKAFTIYGGSQEVQSNIISKRILGLPDLTQHN